jgi:hypothetical protein
MFDAYFTGKSLFRLMALVLCFYAFLRAPLGNLHLLVLAILGLFGLLTWLASPKKSPHRRIDESKPRDTM